MMKDLCIVHIGMPKTGSTSLQNALFSGIQDKRFKYANSAEVNHSVSIFSLFTDNAEQYYYHVNNNYKIDEINAFNAINRERLISGFNDNNSKVEIISGEDIFHLPEYGILRLRDFLKTYFKEIIIVGYVRPPKSFMESAFQQLVKYHNVADFCFDIIYHPYKNFEKFDRVFGKENVNLWKFDPRNFPGGDITSDFCQRFGIGGTFEKQARDNESISMEAISALFCYNGLINKSDYGADNARFNDALVETVRCIGNARFKFSQSLINSVLQHYSDDLDWIECRMGINLRDEQHEDGGIGSPEELIQVSKGIAPALKQIIGEKYKQIDPFIEATSDAAILMDIIKRIIAIESGACVHSHQLKSMIEKDRITYMTIRLSGLFDEKYYAEEYSDMLQVKSNGGDLLAHYVQHGEKEGRNPNKEFNSQWYGVNYPDVSSSGLNFLYHYIVHGRFEGRPCQPNTHTSLLTSL